MKLTRVWNDYAQSGIARTLATYDCNNAPTPMHGWIRNAFQTPQDHANKVRNFKLGSKPNSRMHTHSNNVIRALSVHEAQTGLKRLRTKRQIIPMWGWVCASNNIIVTARSASSRNKLQPTHKNVARDSWCMMVRWLQSTNFLIQKNT